MTDRLHPATRAIVSAKSPDDALKLAQALASATPADFDPGEWLTVTVGNSRGGADPRWYAVTAFAYEQLGSHASRVDALNARANLIMPWAPTTLLPSEASRN